MYEKLSRYFFAINCMQGMLYGSARERNRSKRTSVEAVEIRYWRNIFSKCSSVYLCLNPGGFYFQRVFGTDQCSQSPTFSVDLLNAVAEPFKLESTPCHSFVQCCTLGSLSL